MVLTTSRAVSPQHFKRLELSVYYRPDVPPLLVAPIGDGIWLEGVPDYNRSRLQKWRPSRRIALSKNSLGMQDGHRIRSDAESPILGSSV